MKKKKLNFVIEKKKYVFIIVHRIYEKKGKKVFKVKNFSMKTLNFH